MESGGPHSALKVWLRGHLVRMCLSNASARALGTSPCGAPVGAMCGEPLLSNTAGLETWGLKKPAHLCVCVCVHVQVRMVVGLPFNMKRICYVSGTDEQGRVSAFKKLSA